LNPSKLKHNVFLVVFVAKLKVFDRGDADPSSKIQDKRTQIDIPPGRSILQSCQSQPIRIRTRWIGVAIILLLLLLLKLNLFEAGEHRFRVIRVFSYLIDVISPDVGHHLFASIDLGNANVHDAGSVAQQVGSVSNGPTFQFLRSVSSGGGIGNGSSRSPGSHWLVAAVAVVGGDAVIFVFAYYSGS